MELMMMMFRMYCIQTPQTLMLIYDCSTKFLVVRRTGRHIKKTKFVRGGWHFDSTRRRRLFIRHHTSDDVCVDSQHNDTTLSDHPPTEH